MSDFFNRIEILFLYNFINISDRMIKFSINFTIWFRLFSIKFLIIFVENMRSSNFIGWNFKEVRNLFVSYYNKAIFFRWRKIFVFVKLFFSFFWINMRIFRRKCIKHILWMIIISFNWFRNEWTNNRFIILNELKKRFCLFNWINNVRRMDKVINMMKNITILFGFWFKIYIFAFRNFIT